MDTTANRTGTIVRFGRADPAILREAARWLRDRAPRPDVCPCGFVRPKTGEEADDRTVSLRARIDGQHRPVSAVLERADYDRAVRAHRDRTPVVLSGDLDRTGQRWRLLSPRLTDVIHEGDPDPCPASAAGDSAFREPAGNAIGRPNGGPCGGESAPGFGGRAVAAADCAVRPADELSSAIGAAPISRGLGRAKLE